MGENVSDDSVHRLYSPYSLIMFLASLEGKLLTKESSGFVQQGEEVGK